MQALIVDYVWLKTFSVILLTILDFPTCSLPKSVSLIDFYY